MSVTAQRFLLFFMVIACCMPAHTQLPCCQVQEPASTFGPFPSPQLVAFSPLSNCLAVANSGDNTVSLFTIDDNCTLTSAGTPATFDTAITALAFSPISNCLAVANTGDGENPGTVSVFTFDPDTCILDIDPVSTSPVGFSPNTVAFSSNNCLAVLDNAAGAYMFTIGDDPTACSLTPVANNPFNVGINPTSLAFSPTGDCLAIASLGFGTNFVSLFTVNPADCSLSAGSSLNIPSGLLLSLAVSSNNCLAVINFNNTVSMFAIGDNCSLAAVGDPVPLNALPTSVAFSSNGSCLAITTSSDEENPGAVSLFTVAQDCSLTQIQGSPIELPADSNPTSVAFSANNCLVAASPDTNTLLVFSPFTIQQPSITSAEVTVCPTVLVTGTADPNVTIDLFANGDPTSIASGSTDGAGNFSIEITSLLPGTYSITAVSTALGCTSIASVPAMVTIALTQPVIASAEVTSCPFITVVGTADPNVTITLFADGDLNPIGSGSTDNTGNFIITTTASLPLGTHSITAAATTPGGCTSDLSNPVEVTIALPEPVITNATVTNCNTVTVMGTTGPNATVTLFVDDIPNATGLTDDAGNFTIDTTPLPAGTHSITAIATTSDCTSMFSNAIPATTSAAPVITSTSFACGNIITVMGTSTPNTSVTLLADTLSIATGITNSEGIFRIMGVILPANTQCITALDNSSGCSSVPVCLTAPSTPCVFSIPNLAFGTHCNR